MNDEGIFPIRWLKPSSARICRRVRSIEPFPRSDLHVLTDKFFLESRSTESKDKLRVNFRARSFSRTSWEQTFDVKNRTTQDDRTEMGNEQFKSTMRAGRRLSVNDFREIASISGFTEDQVQEWYIVFMVSFSIDLFVKIDRLLTFSLVERLSERSNEQEAVYRNLRTVLSEQRQSD